MAPQHLYGANHGDSGALSAPIDRRLLPDSAEVGENGHLHVGGVDLVELAHDIGTPFFVYDQAHLRHRCRMAVQAWGGHVAYATKAFLCKAMARLAHAQGMRLDVSTLGELHVVLAAGVPPARIVLHGNNKSELEIATALSVGVGRIVVDSFDEIDRIGRLTDVPPLGGPAASEPGITAGGERAPRPKVLVRVTPGIDAHTHQFVRTGQEDTKFGFSIASGAASRAVASLELLPGVELVGVHAHIGSQVFDLRSFERAAEVVGAFAAPLELPEVVLGGGLGVAYRGSDLAPTTAEWAELTLAACRRVGLGEHTTITAEPGRSIVATAGITVYTVGTLKDLPGIRTYLAVDGGLSDNPRPILYDSPYDAFLPRDPAAERPFVARIVGKHCETGDVLVATAHLPRDVRVGDLLATPVTGAYGYSMASNYNKVPRPPIVFVTQGVATTVVRRETIQDLLNLEC